MAEKLVTGENWQETGPRSMPSRPAAPEEHAMSGSEKEIFIDGAASSSPPSPPNGPPASTLALYSSPPAAAASDVNLESSGVDDVAAGRNDSFSSPFFSKYRPETKSPWDGADVRWYFSKAPLGLKDAAAGVPATEVVGKGEYLRFSKRDSLSLEAAFLQDEEELVSAWWKEYAECNEGPAVSAVSQRVSGSGDSPTAGSSHHVSERGSTLSPTSQNVAEDKEQSVGILVKGGLYEVGLLKRRCSPVYWRGDNMRVLRGHWFARRTGLDWLPLREDVAEQLESAYASQVWRRRSYQPSGQYAARVNLKSTTQGLHALFFGEDDTWEAVLSVDATRVASVLGIRGAGFKLRRGFAAAESSQPSQEELAQRKEEEMDDYCSQVPVRHVVFMVHGIGQRLEKANLVDDVGTFRRTAAAMAEHHLTAYQRNAQRVLFIPCQWRRELKLRGESAVENCTLDGVRALRTMLSATVHDVLYYMSPVYCQDIIDSVSISLNKLYRRFIKRNPGYDGKVSIYGHSLGSVLSYDILCHQEDVVSSPMHGVMPPVFKDSKESLPPANSVPRNEESDASEKKQHGDLQDLKHVESAEDDSNNENKQPIQDDCKEVETLRKQIAALQEKLVALERESKVHEQRPASPIRSTDNLTKNSESRVHLGKDHPPTCKMGPDLRSTDSLTGSRRHDFRISYAKLDFQVDTFYAVGSPLGVFLSLRNIRLGTGEGQEYWEDDTIQEELPACRQLINIFHPYDPVAYRIEPLVCKELIGKRPVFIPYHKGGKRIHIGMQELGENLTAQSKAIVHTLTSVRTRMASAFSASSVDRKGDDSDDDNKLTYGSKIMERLTGSPHGRIDHMLQDATFEHQYIAAISSHTSYWQDLDTALFIVKHLYRDCPEEHLLPDLPADSAPADPSASVRFHDDADIADDEVAFTFFGKDEIVAVMADAEKSVSPGGKSPVSVD